MCASSDLPQSPQIMEPVTASSSVRRHLRERPSSTLGIGIRSEFSKAVAHNQCGGNRGPEDAGNFVAVTVLSRQRLTSHRHKPLEQSLGALNTKDLWREDMASWMHFMGRRKHP